MDQVRDGLVRTSGGIALSLTTPELQRQPWARLFAAALSGTPCDVIWSDGSARALPMASWVQAADATDRLLLASCVGATVDIGCGPGRMSAQLVLDHHVVLGIDVVPEAVAQARARGVGALRRDVFGPVPAEGRWETALLADGNIGIGGDPRRLLRRVRKLVGPGGRVVVELAPFGAGLNIGTAALSAGGQRSDPFPWAVVGADVIAPLAAGVGFAVSETHEHLNRWWTVLMRED